MHTNNRFEETVAKLIAENPEGELAQLPINGFEYQLLSLIGNNAPKNISEGAEMVMSLSSSLGALSLTICDGNVECTLEMLKLCYEAQAEKAMKLGRK